MKLRKVFDPPVPPADRVLELVEIAETIRDGLDCGDAVDDLVQSFNDKVPMEFDADDFFAVSSAMSAEDFVRCAFAVPPKGLNATDEELVELVVRLKAGAPTLQHDEYWLRVIKESVLHPDVVDLIHSDLSASDIVAKARSYYPIQLGPSSSA